MNKLLIVLVMLLVSISNGECEDWNKMYKDCDNYGVCPDHLSQRNIKFKMDKCIDKEVECDYEIGRQLCDSRRRASTGCVDVRKSWYDDVCLIEYCKMKVLTER